MKMYRIPIKCIGLGLILLMIFTACSSRDNKGINTADSSTEVSVDTTEPSIHEVAVKYSTVTERFDFGSATSKVILEFEDMINSNSVDKSLFVAEVVRTYLDSEDRVGKEYIDMEHIVSRTITNAYVSDSEGRLSDIGRYITIEMDVTDDKSTNNSSASKPYQMNKETHFNYMIDFYYIIQLVDGANIKLENGDFIIFAATDKNNYLGDFLLEKDDFVHNQKHTYEDVTLGYAYYEPVLNVENNQVPLFIWLHDYPMGGNDTRVPINFYNVSNLKKDVYQKVLDSSGAYVLIPQTQSYWMDPDGSNSYYLKKDYTDTDGNSYYARGLLDLVESFASAHPTIDQNKIYVAGNGLGGYMTVTMLIEYPDYFAAGIPIGTPYSNDWINNERLDKLKQTPIWFVHGLFDDEWHSTRGSSLLDYSLVDHSTKALYDGLIEIGDQNVFCTMPEVIQDKTGQFFTDDMEPFVYKGQYAWMLLFNNDIKEEINGQDVTILEWLSNQVNE